MRLIENTGLIIVTIYVFAAVYFAYRYAVSRKSSNEEYELLESTILELKTQILIEEDPEQRTKIMRMIETGDPKR